jgi:biopolymer transport protein ExbD
MAGSFGGDDDDGEIVGINVTPLVDVVLVLLIIFMVTTSVITNAEGIKVDKPDAATGNTLEKTTILLVCRTDGTVLVDGNEAADDQAITAAIQKKLADDDQLQGVVQCDQGAQVGEMVRLIDLLRAAGVKKYAIATEKPPADKSSG